MRSRDGITWPRHYTCHNIMNATSLYLVKKAVGELLEADVVLAEVVLAGQGKTDEPLVCFSI